MVNNGSQVAIITAVKTIDFVSGSFQNQLLKLLSKVETSALKQKENLFS